jgi:MFS family permease
VLMTGIGVGLTLPTFMATGAAALPSNSFATGSGVINMLRQVGLAVGVSVFVAVVGTPATPEDALHAFEHGWTVIAIIGFLAAVVGAVVLRTRPAATGRAGTDRAAGTALSQAD